MFDAVFGRVLRLWLANQARGFLSTSRPSGALHVHAMGADPDRILLVLDRPSVGDGMLSQELGLAGHLARQLSTLSGRGTDIDILANGNMTAEETRKALRTAEFGRFDSIILMVGSSEALSLTRPHRWVHHLNVLLDDLAARMPHRVELLLIEIPPTRALIDFPRPFAVAVDARINELNIATREVCAGRAGVSVLPFPLPSAAVDGRNSSDAFRQWARFIAPAIRAQLDLISGTDRPDETAIEDPRSIDLAGPHVIDSLPDPRIDQIVLSARDRFNTRAAALTFLDHHRRWVKSAVGTHSDETPRIGSLCDLAIDKPGAFVIEDLGRSEHVYERSDGDFVTEFYAGYPIEAPDGRRVAVLCVMDSKPRHFSAGDEALLRELALRLQAVLWRPS